MCSKSPSVYLAQIGIPPSQNIPEWFHKLSNPYCFQGVISFIRRTFSCPFNVKNAKQREREIDRKNGFPNCQPFIGTHMKSKKNPGFPAMSKSNNNHHHHQHQHQHQHQQQQPTTNNPQPTTDNPQPTTHNPQPTTTTSSSSSSTTTTTST